MQILRGHKAAVRTLAFSPDGKLLASGGADDTIRLWRFPEGVEWDRPEAPPYLAPCLAFSPDGRWLAAPGDEAWVWDLSNPSERRHLPLKGWDDRHDFADAVTFTPDGKRLLLTGQRGRRWDGGHYRQTEALVRSWHVGTWDEAPAGDFVIPSDFEIAWSRFKPCSCWKITTPGVPTAPNTDTWRGAYSNRTMSLNDRE